MLQTFLQKLLILLTPRGVAGDAGRVADGEAEGVLREGEGREALRARLEVRGGALVALADVPGLALPSLLLFFFRSR